MKKILLIILSLLAFCLPVFADTIPSISPFVSSSTNLITQRVSGNLLLLSGYGAGCAQFTSTGLLQSTGTNCGSGGGGSGSGTVTSVGLSAPTGFTVSGSPVTTSGTLGLSFASGYALPTIASTTSWNNFLNASATLPYYLTFQYASTTFPSFTYASSTFVTYAYGSSTYQTALTTGNLTSGTGLTTTGGTGAVIGTGASISASAGYNIPLTASTTAWQNFLTSPLSVINAGTGLSWSGNTLNSWWTYNSGNLYNNNSGNVGIGTINPVGLLTVGSTANSSPGQLVINDYYNGAGVAIPQFISNWASTGYFAIGPQTGTNDSTLRIGTVNNYGTSWPATDTAFKLVTMGSMGIGTTTPSKALTVIGDISDSNLTSGDCVQASTGGLLTTTASPCGSGGGGGANYWSFLGNNLFPATTTSYVTADHFAATSTTATSTFAGAIALQGSIIATSTDVCISPDLCQFPVAAGGANAQIAMNNAMAYLQGLGGGRLHIKQGNYTLASRVNFVSNIDVVGDGDATVIYVPGGDKGFRIADINNGQIDNDIVENVHFDGTNQTGSAFNDDQTIQIKDAHNIKILNNTFTNIKGFGIYTVSDPTVLTNASTSNVIIQGNHIESLGLQDAIGGGPFDPQGESTTSDITVIGNDVTQTATVNGSEQSVMDVNAFDMVGVENINVQGNHFRGNIHFGIEQSPNQFSQISNNLIDGAVATATTTAGDIILENATSTPGTQGNISIIGNTLRKGQITVNSSAGTYANLLIANNNIQGAPSTYQSWTNKNGIDLNGVTNSSVTGNIMVAGSGSATGINVQNSTNVVTETNTITGYATGVALNSGSGNKALVNTYYSDTANESGVTYGLTFLNNQLGVGTSSPVANLAVVGTGLFTATTTAPCFNNTPNGACITSSGGTVTSVSMTTPTGLTVSGSPITTSGNLAITLTSGYNIPLTASTTNWNNFFNTPCSYLTAGTNITCTGTSTISSTGGGGSGNSAWTIGKGLIYNATSTDQVLIDETASTSQAKLDVNGDANLTAGHVYRINGNQELAASTTLFNLFVGNGGNLGATGNYNTSLGDGALSAVSSGFWNIGIGYQALNSVTSGFGNIGIGYTTLKTTTGSGSTAIGTQDLVNTTGSDDTALGYNTLQNDNTGAENTAVGSNAGLNVTTGMNDTYVGRQAATYQVGGSNNVAVGFQTGLGNYLNYSDNRNTFVGAEAAFYASSSADNAAFGYGAGNILTTGTENTFLGSGAQSTASTTGSQNIAIGYDTSLPSGTANGQLNIGNFIYGTGLTGTGSTVSSGNIGIGTTSPAAPLSVVGNIYQNGTFEHFGNSLCGYSNSFLGGTGLEVCGADNTNAGSNLILSNSTAGTSSFADLLLENDIANDGLGDNYAVVNLNSSQYANSTYGNFVNMPNQLLVQNTIGNVAIDTASSTSGSIVFATGGVNTTNQRMVILPNGNVGVGTTSPVSPFSVNGPVTFFGQCVTGDTKLRRRKKKAKVEGKDQEYDYDTVALTDIKVGDEIESFDEANGVLVYKEVKEIIEMGERSIFGICTVSGKSIHTTQEHPYWTASDCTIPITSGEWKLAQEIMPNMYVGSIVDAACRMASWDKVLFTEILPEEAVYDLKIADTHTFIGNDIIAHNTGTELTITGTTSVIGLLQVNNPTNNGVTIGNVFGNTRGAGALDIQAAHDVLTQVAAGASSTAVGLDNSIGAAACSSSAFGICNTASGYCSSAFGAKNTSGCKSSAFGFQNLACVCSSASGYQNNACGTKSSAFGEFNTITGCQASGFGYNNTSAGSLSSSIGTCNVASGCAASAVGRCNTASSYTSSAFGYDNTASCCFTSALGVFNTASASSSSAFGFCNRASATSSSAFGFNNTASGCFASAFGVLNTASGCFASAFGSNLTNNNACTIMLGASSSALADISIDINGRVKSARGSSGRVTLSGGTATVSGVTIDGASIILLTDQSAGTANLGSVAVGATTSSSFVITSSNASDSSVVAWFITETQ